MPLRAADEKFRMIYLAIFVGLNGDKELQDLCLKAMLEQ